MPKKNLSINKFEQGILNRYDKRDIPEGGLHSLVDAIPDIEGSVRQMGSSIDHTNVKLFETEISGTIKEGKGLFAFNSDFALTRMVATVPPTFTAVSVGDVVRSKNLAIQQGNSIGIWDEYSAILINDAIRVNTGDNVDLIEPFFSYIDGTLRVSD